MPVILTLLGVIRKAYGPDAITIANKNVELAARFKVVEI
jgi:hypothetical protein